MINYYRALSSLLNKNLTGFSMIFSIFFILSIALFYESTIQKKAICMHKSNERIQLVLVGNINKEIFYLII